MTTSGAQVTKFGMLAMQVCVPAPWSDDQVREFAESRYPCGTERGWQIRRQGDPKLKGMAERVRCRERAGYVHVMLDA